MRKFILFLVLVGAGIWVYKNPTESRAYVGEGSLYLADQLQKLAAYWHPKSAQEVQVRTEAKNVVDMSPDIFVLRVPVSAPSSSGVVTLSPGTDMRKVGEGNGRYVLTNGVHQVIVETEKVTRDPLEIRDLKRILKQAGETTMNSNRAELESELIKVKAEISATTKELVQVNQKIAEAKQRGMGTSMATSPDFLRTRLTRLEKRAAEIQSQLQRMSPSA